MQRVDLTNKKIGRLTVIKYVGHVWGKRQRHAMWLCICDCGSEKVFPINYLTNKYNNKSCGCWSPLMDLSGKRFGRLQVMGQADNQEKRAQWLCKCDCGNQKVIGGHLLRDGKTKSCGCLGLESKTKHGMYKSPECSLLYSARRRAKANGMEFSLTLGDIKIPKHCPILGIELIHSNKTNANSPSIDRIDNDKGYTADNIAIISYRANGLKSNMSLDIMEKIESYIIQHVSI